MVRRGLPIDTGLPVEERQVARRRIRTPGKGFGILAVLLCVGLPIGCEPAQKVGPALEGEPAMGQGEATVPDPENGLIVEAVKKGTAADLLGVQVGDVLLSWKLDAQNDQLAEDGDLETPWQLFEVSEGKGPRGTVQLKAERSGVPVTFEFVRVDGWGLSTRPVLDPDVRDLYDRASLLRGSDSGGAAEPASPPRAEEFESPEGEDTAGVDADRANRASRQLREIAETAGTRVRADLALFFHYRSAEWLSNSGLLPWEDLQAATTIAEGLDSASLEWVLDRHAGDRHQQDQLAEALALRGRQLRLREARGDEVLIAQTTLRQAITEFHGQNIVEAERYFRRAVDRLEEVAPDSLPLARAWSHLGRISSMRGDTEAGETLFKEALEVRQRLVPDGMEVAFGLGDLGTHMAIQGRLAEAQEYYEQNLKLWQELEPGSLREAVALGNLGTLAGDRGNLALAERLRFRSLGISRAHGESTRQTAFTLSNLANGAIAQRDLERAEVLLREALTIQERLLPDSLDYSHTLENLASLSRLQGDSAAAALHLRRSLEIRRKINPEHHDLGYLLAELALQEREAGNYSAARELIEDAIVRVVAQAPDSVAHANILCEAAELEFAEARLERALDRWQRSLSIFDRTAPGSYRRARPLEGIARVQLALGDVAKARVQFERGIEAFESQDLHLGSALDRARMSRRFDLLVSGYLDLLVDEGEFELALLLLERLRSRQFRSELEGRELVLSRGGDSDLDRRRRQQAVESDRLRQRLQRLSQATQPDDVRRLGMKLEQVDRERRATWEEMVRTDPDLASFDAPVLTLEQIAGSLEGTEGDTTLLLSFHLGARHSRLFAVDASGRVEVFEVGASREELNDLVLRFRRLVNASESPNSVAPIRALGKQIYSVLFDAAEQRLSDAHRLLLVVEGGLHELPFGALSRTDPETGADQWLIEWKALHTASSASAYAALRLRATRKRNLGPQSIEENTAGVGLVALGDPAYDRGERDRSASQALRRGELSPIPWTRSEAISVARRIEPSRAVLGSDATESAAREALGNAQIAHFAVHGYNDMRLPLDSGLAFASEEATSQNQNGILQAWEILEEVQVRASLVVLSSCESGLGLQLGIEGSFGLPRALQIAGADSVVTSLWRISDRSTAALMDHFYGGLAAGLNRDEALRQAQLSLVRGPVPLPSEGTSSWWSRLTGRRTEFVDATHPYHWSGLQLDGDWAPSPVAVRGLRADSH